MKTRHGVVRQAGILVTSAFLALAVSAVAGCASSGRTNAQGADAAQQNAGNDAQARCRAAIADVTRLCNAESPNAARCEDAKSRSRASCI